MGRCTRHDSDVGEPGEVLFPLVLTDEFNQVEVRGGGEAARRNMRVVLWGADCEGSVLWED